MQHLYNIFHVSYLTAMFLVTIAKSNANKNQKLNTVKPSASDPRSYRRLDIY